MSPFTENEIEYLRGQRLGRMATVGGNGGPRIVPVGFRLDSDAQTIQIGGHGLSKSKKWRDLLANPKLAFVVDDLASVDPWTPRGIEVRGTAALHHEGGGAALRSWRVGLSLVCRRAAADHQLGYRGPGLLWGRAPR